MVVDNKTGIRDIARDIRKQVMVLQGVSSLLLLVGRADILNNENMLWVLEGLIQAVEQVQYTGFCDHSRSATCSSGQVLVVRGDQDASPELP